MKVANHLDVILPLLKADPDWPILVSHAYSTEKQRILYVIRLNSR